MSIPVEAFPRRGRTLLLVCLVASLLATGFAPSADAAELLIAKIDGSINPATADYLISAIRRAEDEQAAALLIELDTPGGLVSSTQDIIREMLNARVPVIVYVTPRGAWAASAGTFITLASTVAAMSPGSSIGAAHPVSAVGGGDEGEGQEGQGGRNFAAEKAENFLAAYVESIAKQKNRNVEWAIDAVRNSVAITADKALELNVIDLVADSRAELLEAIEGREVEVAGSMLTLAVVRATPVDHEMTAVQSVFSFLADPNVAVILLGVGLLGLYMEFQAPGMIVPGAIGAVALVLAGFAFQVLPFSWIGLAVLLLGVVLLIAELFVTSFGVLFAAGIACFLVGGMLVFERPDLSDLRVSFWEVLVPMATAMTIFGGVLVYSIGRSFRLGATKGLDEMVGLIGRCETPLDPNGRVFVRGEIWNGVASESIAVGEPVEILEVDGLTLRVRRAESSEALL